MIVYVRKENLYRSRLEDSFGFLWLVHFTIKSLLFFIFLFKGISELKNGKAMQSFIKDVVQNIMHAI